MRAVILAAGYATRLYPLTRNFPKPLLPLGSTTILDLLIDQIAGIPDIGDILVVTNHRFLPFFERWRLGRPHPESIALLDDGTTSNEDRLGALGDLRLALDRFETDSDVLVAAADNVLQFSLGHFIAAFHRRRACHICVHRMDDPARLRRTGVAVLDDTDRVVIFTEKPAEPQSRWAVPPLYLFPRESLPGIKGRLSGGGPNDAPGHLIEWLCRLEPVCAHRIHGAILDVGTPESLEAARKLFAAPPQA